MRGAKVSEIKQIGFGLSYGKMFFKLGVQKFTLDYEPDTTEDFEFMKDNLLQAFSKAGVNVIEKVQQKPVAWKHNCNALCVIDLELWIEACPHCGKPRQNPPTTADAVRELVEALKPFAAFDLRGDSLGYRDDNQAVYARDDTVLMVGDFKRAIEALTKAKEHGL